MLTGEDKYSDHVVDYIDAWSERTAANGGIIPSNVGLDGTHSGIRHEVGNGTPDMMCPDDLQLAPAALGSIYDRLILMVVGTIGGECDGQWWGG